VGFSAAVQVARRAKETMDAVRAYGVKKLLEVSIAQAPMKVSLRLSIGCGRFEGKERNCPKLSGFGARK
jgi:hypothetical protein